VSLGLLVKKDGRYRNAPSADTFLRAGAQHLTRAAVGEDLVRDAIMQAMAQSTEIP
jgi:hypothetical protein